MSFDKDCNEHLMTRDDIDNEIPKGWKWTNQWQADIVGNVASDGEYRIYVTGLGLIIQVGLWL